MRLILKYTVFTILCCLFLMDGNAFAQVKQTETTPAVKSGKNPSGDKAGKSDKTTPANAANEIELPDVDGWEKGEKREYPTPELGYSVPYQSEDGGTVTVYVYNGGVKNISEDVNDKTIKNEIERAKNDIIQVGKSGSYENVKEIKTGVQTLGGKSGKVKVQYALFNFKARGQDLTSEIYIFGYQSNFIKIRATRPKEAVGTENKALTTLLAEIDAVFAK